MVATETKQLYVRYVPYSPDNLHDMRDRVSDKMALMASVAVEPHIEPLLYGEPYEASSRV
jgi:hypothetical protein